MDAQKKKTDVYEPMDSQKTREYKTTGAQKSHEYEVMDAQVIRVRVQKADGFSEEN